jgi:hypothetical protein
MRLFRLPRTINQTFSGASLYQFADDILSVRRIQNCAKRGLQSPLAGSGLEKSKWRAAGIGGWKTGSQRYVGQHGPTESPNAMSGNIPGVDTIVITSSDV